LAATAASLKMIKDIRMTENRRYDAESRRLWIPEGLPPPGGIRRSASRETIGFVTSAQFAYHAGGCIVVGFVALAGLRQLMMTSSDDGVTSSDNCVTSPRVEPLVLVRETTSLQYRFARLKVVLSS
jgi:hypothetical protein